MTAERKPSEIADPLALANELEQLTLSQKRCAGEGAAWLLTHRHELVAALQFAALRSAAPPRGEPVAQQCPRCGGSGKVPTPSFSDSAVNIDRSCHICRGSGVLAAPSAGRDAEDARRYRWLRANPNFMGWEHDFRAEEVDAAVDREMARDKAIAALSAGSLDERRGE